MADVLAAPSEGAATTYAKDMASSATNMATMSAEVVPSDRTETLLHFGPSYLQGAHDLSLFQLPDDLLQQAQADPTMTIKFMGRDGEDAVVPSAPVLLRAAASATRASGCALSRCACAPPRECARCS